MKLHILAVLQQGRWANDTLPRMVTAEELLPNLVAVREEYLSEVWPDGRNANVQDGGHFVLQGTLRPVSISRIEGYFLTNVARGIRATRALEIGTGFGYSTIWLAMALSERGGLLTTIDNRSEGESSERNSWTAHIMAERVGIADHIEFVVGTSPEALSSLSGAYDLAFIDGAHHGEQPIQDYRAVQPLVGDDSLILFHDNDPDRYDVHLAIAEATSDGWKSRVLPTSCHMTVMYRSSSHLVEVIDRAMEWSGQELLARWP